jgi:Signal transduction histidine kinase
MPANPDHLFTQLQRAKDAAEVANVAKIEFLTNLSHQVRTAMQSIIGMTEEVLTSELTSEQRGDLNAVEDSARSLHKILNDTLDWFKIAER